MSPAMAALSILLTAMPAFATDDRLPVVPDLDDGESATAKPSTLNWRATQVNRCANARGTIALQDTPCTPVAAEATSMPGDVTELSSLPPRALPKAPRIPAQEPGTRAWVKVNGLREGAWKLALLLVGGYIAFRVARTLPEHYVFKRSFAARSGPGRPTR